MFAFAGLPPFDQFRNSCVNPFQQASRCWVSIVRDRTHTLSAIDKIVW